MPTLGIVPYLNAVPLVADLEAEATLVALVPSELSHELEAGRVDAALIPVAEAIRGVGDGYLGRFGITSDGPVMSVLLFLRRPLCDVRSVVLDPASRASAGMARHLVREAAGREVTFDLADVPGPDPREEEGDAVLLIGDPAMAYRELWPDEIVDLGALWKERVALPFVYARWTARRGLAEGQRAQIQALLDTAGASGLLRRESLARSWAAARGVNPDEAARYVLEHVRYEIGPREEAGLRRYAEILEAERADEARRGRRHA